jgi:hypothetical protein
LNDSKTLNKSLFKKLAMLNTIVEYKKLSICKLFYVKYSKINVKFKE